MSRGLCLLGKFRRIVDRSLPSALHLEYWTLSPCTAAAVEFDTIDKRERSLPCSKNRQLQVYHSGSACSDILPTKNIFFLCLRIYRHRRIYPAITPATQIDVSDVGNPSHAYRHHSTKVALFPQYAPHVVLNRLMYSDNYDICVRACNGGCVFDTYCRWDWSFVFQ